MSKIAFIGLGNMGGPMASNLLKAGHHVTVFDLVAKSMQILTEQGAHRASSAAQAVENAEFVITMLPASKHVESLYLGNNGLLKHCLSTALVIDCSTIAADELGLSMIDAPVSGGTGGAIAGTLTFIVGGNAEDLARARPLLEKMGKNIFHAGAAGAGQVAKIANNMLLGIAMAGTAEALALGVANGLDPKILSEIISKSTGCNWSIEKYNPWPGVLENVPAAKGYAGGFGVDLMLKDLGLASEAAISTGSVIALGELARNLFALHSSQGHGQLDFSSIVNLIKRED
jgi:3-hydroxyisobutyrate dehydrogenase